MPTALFGTRSLKKIAASKLSRPRDLPTCFSFLVAFGTGLGMDSLAANAQFESRR
jgi:hypothetical protein